MQITEKQFDFLSIKDNQLKANIRVYNPSTGDSYQSSYKNEAPIHEEMSIAMERLTQHVQKMAGSDLKQVKVEAFMRQHSGNSELITIYTSVRDEERRCLVSLEVRIRLEDYDRSEQLQEDLMLCEREALLYIVKGKRLGMQQFVSVLLA